MSQQTKDGVTTEEAMRGLNEAAARMSSLGGPKKPRDTIESEPTPKTDTPAADTNGATGVINESETR